MTDILLLLLAILVWERVSARGLSASLFWRHPTSRSLGEEEEGWDSERQTLDFFDGLAQSVM